MRSNQKKGKGKLLSGKDEKFGAIEGEAFAGVLTKFIRILTEQQLNIRHATTADIKHRIDRFLVDIFSETSYEIEVIPLNETKDETITREILEEGLREVRVRIKVSAVPWIIEEDFSA